MNIQLALRVSHCKALNGCPGDESWVEHADRGLRHALEALSFDHPDCTVVEDYVDGHQHLRQRWRLTRKGCALKALVEI